MICTNCGQPLTGNKRFCTCCGAPVPPAPAEAVPEETAAAPAGPENGIIEEPAANGFAEPENAEFSEQDSGVYYAGNGPENGTYSQAVPEPVPDEDAPAPSEGQAFPEIPHQTVIVNEPEAEPRRKYITFGQVIPWVLVVLLAVAFAAVSFFGVRAYRDVSANRAELQQSNFQQEDTLKEKQAEINGLNDTVVEQQTEIDSLGTRVTNQASEIESLNTKAASQASEIENLNGTVAQQEADLEALNGTLGEREAEIADLSGTVSRQESELSENEDTIDALNGQTELLQGFRDSIVWNSKHFTLGGDEKFGVYPSVVVVKTGTAGASFTVYENYSSPITLGIAYNGIELDAKCTSTDADHWDGTATYQISASETGIARIDFKNSVDDRTCSVLVIAVEP